MILISISIVNEMITDTKKLVIMLERVIVDLTQMEKI